MADVLGPDDVLNTEEVRIVGDTEGRGIVLKVLVAGEVRVVGDTEGRGIVLKVLVAGTVEQENVDDAVNCKNV